MADQGKALFLNEANANNLYVRIWHAHEEAFNAARAKVARPEQAFYVLGEAYGRGVQDLHYGEPNPAFAVFDVYVGEPGKGRYLTFRELRQTLGSLFTLVPLVYEGPFGASTLAELTDGRTSMKADHIREGVVVRPLEERESAEFGRVVLKSVSGDYLTRRGGTEFN